VPVKVLQPPVGDVDEMDGPRIWHGSAT